MRRTDKEIRDPEWIDAVLGKALFCHLAFSDDEIPYMVPMNFAWSEGRLILHSFHEGEKNNILRKNPHVSFSVETDVELVTHTIACRYGMRYRSVIGRGNVRFVEEDEEKNYLLRILAGKYTTTPVHDFSPEELTHVTVLVITPTILTGKNSGYHQTE